MHGAAIVLQRALRRRLAHAHAGQPSQVRLGPVGLRAVEAHFVAQQQLGQAMARAHQIAAQVLARTHQVAQRLLLDARDRNAMQLAGHQQPDQPLGITTIGFHPIRCAARDQPRRAHRAVDPHRVQLARQHEARWPGLICCAHRPGQPGCERHYLVA